MNLAPNGTAVHYHIISKLIDRLRVRKINFAAGGFLLTSLAACSTKPSQLSSATLEKSSSSSMTIPVVFDLKPLLAVTSRIQMERLIGKPKRIERCCNTDSKPKFDICYYRWGEIQYDPRQRAEDINVDFASIRTYQPDTPHPASTSEALQMVGLDETSNPGRVGGNYRWCPQCDQPWTSPALSSNGMTFHDVTVFGSDALNRFSGVTVSGKYFNSRSK